MAQSRLSVPHLVLVGGLAAAAAGVGVLYPLAAYFVHPLALPAVLVFGALGVITLSRLEVGAALALVIAALSPDLAGARLSSVVLAWTAFLLLAALERWFRREHGETALPPLGFVSLLFLALGVIGLLRSPEPGSALPVLRSAVVGIVLFFVIATAVRSRRQVERILFAAGIGAILVGGYATWQYLTGTSSPVGFVTSSGEVVGRVTAGFTHPNQLGGFLVVLIPVALAGAALSRRSRALYLVAIVLASIAVYASFSRSALIGLAVVPLVFLRWRHAVVALPILASAALLVTPGLVRERFATLNNAGAEVSTRTDFWRAATTVWADHPVLGAGLGSFATEYAGTRLSGKQFLPSTTFQPPPHAHNLFLQLLAEQGIAGLGIFLAVLGVGLRHAWPLLTSEEAWVRTVTRAVLASQLAFLIHNQLDVTLSEGTAVYFWAFLGLISALSTMSTSTKQQLPTERTNW